MMTRFGTAAIVAIWTGSMLAAATPATTSAPVGWRGDGSGVYPDASPPVEWSRKSRGISRTLLTQTTRPSGDSVEKAQPMRDGVVRRWLVVGPFKVEDSAKALDQEQTPDEAKLEADEGGKVGELAWKPLVVVGDKDDKNFYNTVSLNWVNLLGVNSEASPVAYAHCYVFAPAAGTVRLILDHTQGLKLWVNGKASYSQPKQSVAYWAGNNDVYWMEKFIPVPRSAVVKVELAKGWNRLLVKCVRGEAGCQFDARFADADPCEYTTKNIVWSTAMPGFSNAMPVIVGDKVFITSEPDELICVNKKDGKILWKGWYGHYDTLTDDDRKAHAIIREKIDPLAAKLRETRDLDEQVAMRKQMRDLMVSLDPKYTPQIVKHLPIVGYCSPTPCSDGQFVYVISGNGVAACFDLDGKPVWVRYAHSKFKKREGDWSSHGHPGSPVLIDGKFIFHVDYLVALDAKTGRELWRADTDGGNPAPDVINFSLWATSIGKTPVVMTSHGQIYDAGDGHLLWDGPAKMRRWPDAYVAGQGLLHFWVLRSLGTLRLPDSIEGNFDLTVHPEMVSGLPDGGMLLASPLYHDGLVYSVNMAGGLTVVESNTGKLVYSKTLDLNPYVFWNGAGVCASLAMAGGHIYVMDNRGNTIVFKPGRTYEQVARNTIEHNVVRRIPDDQQEFTQSTPAFDGKFIYIRGEDRLYCIGQE